MVSKFVPTIKMEYGVATVSLTAVQCCELAAGMHAAASAGDGELGNQWWLYHMLFEALGQGAEAQRWQVPGQGRGGEGERGSTRRPAT